MSKENKLPAKVIINQLIISTIIGMITLADACAHETSFSALRHIINFLIVFFSLKCSHPLKDRHAAICRYMPFSSFSFYS